MEIIINGLKIQIEGADNPQFVVDKDTNTIRIDVKPIVKETIKVVEKVKIVEVQGPERIKIKYVPSPSPVWPTVPQKPVYYDPNVSPYPYTIWSTTSHSRNKIVP